MLNSYPLTMLCIGPVCKISGNINIIYVLLYIYIVNIFFLMKNQETVTLFLVHKGSWEHSTTHSFTHHLSMFSNDNNGVRLPHKTPSR